MTKPKPVKLNYREWRLLLLISHGYTTARMAGELNISFDAVKNSVKSAYQQLGATDRGSAVRRGFETGFLCNRQPARPLPPHSRFPASLHDFHTPGCFYNGRCLGHPDSEQT